MRALFWHLSYFKSTVTEKGRSPLVEEKGDGVTEAENCMLVLVAVEKKDEQNPVEILQKFVNFIEQHSLQIGVKTVVLHPFAHLFAELARPEVAVDLLKHAENKLREMGFEVYRTPFGWFNELEIKAKGHPISRVARVF